MSASESSTRRQDLNETELLRYGEFRLAVCGSETAWVRSITGNDPATALIAISLNQLTVYGPIAAVRERVAALSALLDAVVAQPEKWEQIKMTQVSGRRWIRDQPHPFVDRPTTTSSRAADL